MDGGSFAGIPLRRPLFPGVARLFSRSLGSTKLLIPFWTRWHTLRKSGMREYKPPPLVCTGASESTGANSHAYHSGARDFPELRVYSRSPFGLVKLGFYLGALACVT